MTKKNINVLVNTSVTGVAYLNFLNERYNVTIVDCKKYGGQQIDLILFTGGEDVSPGYYNERTGSHTACNGSRDELESNYMFFRDEFKTVPKLGICRGAQFLTALSGGKLIQHVTGHAVGKLHPILINHPYNMTMSITSTHHQMMFPYSLPVSDYEIIASTLNYLSNTYLNGLNKENKLPINFEECEIVFYNKTNSLCIQGHPEMSNCPVETKDICLDMISRYLKL